MLNEKQRQLVADNHNMIYSVLYRYNWSVDEWYDMAAIGLCKAAEGFDESKGFKFSTYAYKAIRSEVLREIDRQSRKRKGCSDAISLSAPIGDISHFMEIGETLVNNSDSPHACAVASEIKESIRAMKNAERTALELSMSGYAQKEIAAKMSTGQANVSRIINNARGRLLKYA